MLSHLIETILSSSPWLEVCVKWAYWRFAFMHRLLQSLRRPAIADAPAVDPSLWPLIRTHLQQLGIGDLLIVHSSMKQLKPLGMSPEQIVDSLRALLGPQGTLAMPAFPYFADEPHGSTWMDETIPLPELTYDPATTPCWTGILGTTLMRLPGALRSRHPINSLAAIGPQATAMMAHELDGPLPLPCGRQSAWYYAAQHGARIVALGTDLTHSLTMIHVAEDAYAEEWPIANWYRERRYRIIDGAETMDFACRERRPRWAIHFAERTLARDAARAGILQRNNIGGIAVESCDAAALLTFLNARKASGYPYFTLSSQRKRT